MKVFIIRGAFGDVYEPAWGRSLMKLGHEVFLFDSHKYTSRGIIGRIERKYLIGIGIYRIRKESVRLAKEFKPDVILLYQGHYHDKKSIETLKNIAWVTGYHNDNPFSAIKDKRHYHRYKYFLNSLPAYHSFHVYRHSNIQDIKDVGVDKVKVLMAYYIPEIDFPSEEARNDLSADVIFAGHPEPDGREVYINKLFDNGVDVKIYGDKEHWLRIINVEHHDKLKNTKVLSIEEYRKAIKTSKICLCFFSKWNRDEYTRRVFEIPAMARFLLAERTTVIQSLYKEGSEMELFSDPIEMFDKIYYYLEHENERISVAENGYLRCINSGYSIDSRMEQWVNDILEWKKNTK